MGRLSWKLEYPPIASLPHINSFMMKTETPDEKTQSFFKPLGFEPITKQEPEDYQPMQDSLVDFYSHSFSTNVLDPSSSYTTLAQMQYVHASHLHSNIQYYEMPQMAIYQNEYEPPALPTTTLYTTVPSPAYTPPPQDPSVAVPKPQKKRIAAVPCHSNSICANCKTKETTLWRRNHVGEIECNACNLYFRKNQRKRPLSLRKDSILKRNRKPRCESPNGARAAS